MRFFHLVTLIMAVIAAFLVLISFSADGIPMQTNVLVMAAVIVIIPYCASRTLRDMRKD